MADTTTAGWTVPTILPQQNALPQYLLKFGTPTLDRFNGLDSQIADSTLNGHARNVMDFGRWMFSSGVPQPDTVPINWGRWPNNPTSPGWTPGLLGGTPSGQASYSVGQAGLLGGKLGIPKGEGTGTIGREGGGTGGTGGTGGAGTGTGSGSYIGREQTFSDTPGKLGTYDVTGLPSTTEDGYIQPMDLRYYDYVYTPGVGYHYAMKSSIDPSLVTHTQIMQNPYAAVAAWSGMSPTKYYADSLYDSSGKLLPPNEGWWPSEIYTGP